MARRARRRARRRREAKRATNPLRVFDVRAERVREALAGCAEDRRVALRRLRGALRRGVPLPRRVRRRVHARADARPRARLLHPHGLRVRRPRGRRRSRRSAPAAATTASSRRSAARRRPGSGSAPGSSARCSRSRTKASSAEPQAVDVFFVADGAPRERVLVLLAELRRAGVACDTDYAGRSLQGPADPGRRAAARRRS